MWSWTSTSATATVALGVQIGRCARPGDVLALCGSLGAGKTTLTKGIASGLGYAAEREVRSPTFALINQYEGVCPIYHVDLYRIHQLHEATSIGYETYLGGDGVAVVEWADRLTAWLPQDGYLRVNVEHVSEHERRISLRPRGRRHRLLAQAVVHAMSTAAHKVPG